MWLAFCLAPFVLISALIVWVIMADLIARTKHAFLLKYGTETQAIILEAELFRGPGLHPHDPCFRGKYCFTDRQSHRHTFKFADECYDPYDLGRLELPIEAYYQSGARRRLIYWHRMPVIHHLYGPDSKVPRVRGSAFGLHRLE